jgi:hypothetical protein
VKEDVITLRFAVGTIIGPIRVHVASKLIIAASELNIAANAAEMESKVSCGFEILENSFGGGEMAGERTGILSAKCSDCE